MDSFFTNAFFIFGNVCVCVFSFFFFLGGGERIATSRSSPVRTSPGLFNDIYFGVLNKSSHK